MRVCTVAGSPGTWVSLGASASLTTVDAPCTADATIVNANTATDATGCSASFAAGTWLCTWQMTFQVIVATAQAYQHTGRLWDGTTTYSEAQVDCTPAASANGFSFCCAGSALIVLGGTTTLKLTGYSIRGSSASKIAREVSQNSATSHFPTRLVGVKVS